MKSGKGRSLSSRRWLERQLNDPYVARAKHEGLRSRAAFKLTEIDDKHRLLTSGARVVDLGAAPGGWSQVAARRVGAAEGKGRVVAIDLLEMAPIAGVEFVRLDFLDARAPDAIKARARRTGRCRALRHGGERDRAPARPITSRSWRSPRPPLNLPARCWRRAVHSSARCCKAAPRRPCWRAQARFRPGQAREAFGQPGRFGRALSPGHRLPRSPVARMKRSRVSRDREIRGGRRPASRPSPHFAIGPGAEKAPGRCLHAGYGGNATPGVRHPIAPGGTLPRSAAFRFWRADR